MDRKSTVAIAVIVIVAVIIFIAISFQKSSMLNTDQSANTSTSSGDWVNTPAQEPATTTPNTIPQKLVVTAKHAYRNKVHIIAGEVPLPTPCHILESHATVSSDKKSIFIDLTSSMKTKDICAQVITPARFKITASALPKAMILATLNGQEVTLNLIEAGPTEDLDNFELYIKG